MKYSHYFLSERKYWLSLEIEPLTFTLPHYTYFEESIGMESSFLLDDLHWAEIGQSQDTRGDCQRTSGRCSYAYNFICDCLMHMHLLLSFLSICVILCSILSVLWNMDQAGLEMQYPSQVDAWGWKWVLGYWDALLLAGFHIHQSVVDLSPCQYLRTASLIVSFMPLYVYAHLNIQQHSSSDWNSRWVSFWRGLETR